MNPNYFSNTPQDEPRNPTPPQAPLQNQQQFTQPVQPASSTPYQQEPYAPLTPTQSYEPQPVVNPYVIEPEPVKKKSKKRLAIVLISSIFVLLVALAAAGYYGWNAGWFDTWKPVQMTETQTAEAPVVTQPDTAATPEGVEAEMNDIQQSIDAIDDSQLSDDTISDAALTQ